LPIEHEAGREGEIARKLAVLERITKNLREPDDVEPLSAKFDEIMSKRVNFSRGADLYKLRVQRLPRCSDSKSRHRADLESESASFI
jgi:hypothetical protein